MLGTVIGGSQNMMTTAAVAAMSSSPVFRVAGEDTGATEDCRGTGGWEGPQHKTKDVKNERTNPLCPLESTKVEKNEPKRTPNEPI